MEVQLSVQGNMATIAYSCCFLKFLSSLSLLFPPQTLFLPSSQLSSVAVMINKHPHLCQLTNWVEREGSFVWVRHFSLIFKREKNRALFASLYPSWESAFFLQQHVVCERDDWQHNPFSQCGLAVPDNASLLSFNAPSNGTTRGRLLGTAEPIQPLISAAAGDLRRVLAQSADCTAARLSPRTHAHTQKHVSISK